MEGGAEPAGSARESGPAPDKGQAQRVTCAPGCESTAGPPRPTACLLSPPRATCLACYRTRTSFPQLLKGGSTSLAVGVGRGPRCSECLPLAMSWVTQTSPAGALSTGRGWSWALCPQRHHRPSPRTRRVC